MEKRKRTPGLTGAELLTTVKSIRGLLAHYHNLEQTLNLELESREEGGYEDLKQDDEQDDEAVSKLEEILGMLEARLDGPHHSSSAITQDYLEQKMLIRPGKFAERKSDAKARALTLDAVGEGSHWSAKGLVRHLDVLQNLVPRSNEAATRLWINAFFYRVSAMIPGGSQMVLNLEHQMPSVSTANGSIFGFVEYTAVLTSPTQVKRFLNRRNPKLETLNENDSILFASEAKGPDQLLSNHIAQAVSEMYSCAKSSKRTTTRGVLTNGYEWIFLILKLNADGIGAEYIESEELSLKKDGDVSGMASLISAILFHWFQNSNRDLGSDDYFEFRA